MCLKLQLCRHAAIQFWGSAKTDEDDCIWCCYMLQACLRALTRLSSERRAQAVCNSPALLRAVPG